MALRRFLFGQFGTFLCSCYCFNLILPTEKSGHFESHSTKFHISRFFWKFWPFKNIVLSRWQSAEWNTCYASEWVTASALLMFSDSTSFAPLCYFSDSVGIWVCDPSFWDQLRVGVKTDSPLESENEGIIMLPLLRVLAFQSSWMTANKLHHFSKSQTSHLQMLPLRISVMIK